MVKKSAHLLKGPANYSVTRKKLGSVAKEGYPLKSTAMQTSETKPPVAKT